MIFCLLLVNLLSNEAQLDNLIDYSFPETSYSYFMDIDQDYLDSLSSLHNHNDNNQEEGEGGSSNSPILHANRSESSYKVSHDNMLGRVNNRQTYPNNQDNNKKGRKGAATLLYSMQIIIIVNITYKTTTYNGLIIGKLTLITKKKEREGQEHSYTPCKCIRTAS